MALTKTYNPRLAEAVWWNLLLLTIGGFLLATGVQAVAAPHGFLTGGILGAALLVWYATDMLTVSWWYLLLCIPICIWGWFCVGRRFLLYTAYGTLCTSLFGMVINFHFPVENPFYAAVLAGVLNGTASGIMLRTLGCSGGTDIIAVALKERWNISIGKFSFAFNAALFALASFTISLDMIIVSTIMVFIASNTLDYVLTAFNQRKMVFIISDHGEEICEAIIASEGYGATLLRGKGGYSGTDREILLTVTNNVALKRLENLVFSIDRSALYIVENTFYVSGGQFARKTY